MPAWVDRCVDERKKDSTFKERYEKLKREKGAEWAAKYKTLESFAWAVCTVIYQRNVAKDDEVNSLADLYIEHGMGTGNFPSMPGMRAQEPPTLRVAKDQAPEALDNDALRFTHVVIHRFYEYITGGTPVEGWTEDDLVSYHVRVVKAMEAKEIAHNPLDNLDKTPIPVERSPVTVTR